MLEELFHKDISSSMVTGNIIIFVKVLKLMTIGIGVIEPHMKISFKI